MSIWHAFASRVVFAANRSMIDIFNGPFSTKIVRVLRIYQSNNPTYASTTTFTTMELRRIIDANASGGVGTIIVPIPRDKDQSPINSNITTGSIRAFTQAAAPNLMRRYIFTVGGPLTTQAPILETYELAIPFCEIWNAGYHDTNVQPITARPGEGYAIISTTAGVSFSDFDIEFTEEDT